MIKFIFSNNEHIFIIFNDDDFFSFSLFFVFSNVKSLIVVVNDIVNIEISNRLDDHTKVRFISLNFNVAFSISISQFVFHNRAFAIGFRFLNRFFIRYQTFFVCFYCQFLDSRCKYKKQHVQRTDFFRRQCSFF